MCPLAADIRDARHDMLRQLVLHAEVPLLDIGPACFCRGHVEAQWEGYDHSARATPDARIGWDVRLARVEHQGRSSLQRFHILFVPVSVLVEDPITSATRGFPIAPGIPCEADARSRIKQMPLNATRRNARGAALHHAIKNAGIID